MGPGCDAFKNLTLIPLRDDLCESFILNSFILWKLKLKKNKKVNIFVKK